MSHTLSIVVPCYNEEKNIPLIINRFKEIIKNYPLEVVLVNNGSTDGSAKIFEELCPQHDFISLVTVPVNKGYGYGILRGLKAAKGDFIGWTHADMQTDPHDVIRAYKILEAKGFNKKLFVKGSRRGRSWFDQFFTLGMSCFELLYMQRFLWDINGQPNIFHKSFFAEWQNPPHDFALDLYVLYMAKMFKLRIVRFPVFFPERVHGESKWNTGLGGKVKLIKRTMSFSRTLKKGLR